MSDLLHRASWRVRRQQTLQGRDQRVAVKGKSGICPVEASGLDSNCINLQQGKGMLCSMNWAPNNTIGSVVRILRVEADNTSLRT